MRKLLSANFSRLWRSKIFWVMESGIVLWSLFLFGMFLYNTNQIGENWMRDNAQIYFFYIQLYIGTVIAVFASLFLGTEYSDGTIRNKLIVGHSRWAVYLADLIVVCAAGILFYGTHFLASLICIPAVGAEPYFCIAQPMLRVLYGIINILCYSALFTLMAVLDHAKARCAVVSLVLSLALIFSGLMVYGYITMEETKVQMVLMEDGSYQRQEVPNPRYPTGTKRVIFEGIDDFLPSSQAFHIADRDGNPDEKGAVCLLILSGAMTAAGISLFMKKDIK